LPVVPLAAFPDVPAPVVFVLVLVRVPAVCALPDVIPLVPAPVEVLVPVLLCWFVLVEPAVLVPVMFVPLVLPVVLAVCPVCEFWIGVFPLTFPVACGFCWAPPTPAFAPASVLLPVSGFC